MNRHFIYLGFTLILFQGCGGLTPYEFMKYVEDEKNGFSQTVQVDDIAMDCIYTPPPYMAVKWFKKNNMPKAEFEKKVQEYSAFDLYRLEISASDARNLSALSEYFSFYMQEDIVKISGKDTLPCIIYHGEPFNGVDKKQHIEFGFDKTSAQEETVFIKTNPLTGIPVEITYNKSELKLPKITL